MQGPTVRLRAVEPDDVEIMYLWENDPEVWRVSGTLAPFSRHALMKFVEEQLSDVYLTRQLRLIIENPEGKAAGTLDLFELDPLNRRAGVGILVYDKSERCRGYASEALGLLEGYARRRYLSISISITIPTASYADGTNRNERVLTSGRLSYKIVSRGNLCSDYRETIPPS